MGASGRRYKGAVKSLNKYRYGYSHSALEACANTLCEFGYRDYYMGY